MARAADKAKGQLRGPKQRSGRKRPAAPPPAGRGPGGRRPRRWLSIGAFGVAAAVAIALILVSVLGGEDKPDTTAVDGSQTAALLSGISQNGGTLGSPDARVTLVEYAEPQCPFCARFANEVEPQRIEEYVRPDDVAIEFRGFPFIGPNSIEATT